MDTPSLAWDDLRVLLTVHDAGSFFGAARELGVSTSTVARRIDALERQLGRTLVRRTTDGALVEPAAQALVRVASRMRDELAVAVRDTGEDASSLRGSIRVSLGAGFVPVTAPAIAAFRALHPGITLELVVESRAADLTQREADVGLRTAQVEAEGVVVRRAGPLAYGLFASEAYLAERGRPESIGALADHAFIGYEGLLAQEPVMGWLRVRGAHHFPVQVSTTEGLLTFALAGQGIAAAPTVLAAGYAGLVRLAYPEELPAKSVYVALHREARHIARVRAFADAMTAALSALLAVG